MPAAKLVTNEMLVTSRGRIWVRGFGWGTRLLHCSYLRRLNERNAVSVDGLSCGAPSVVDQVSNRRRGEMRRQKMEERRKIEVQKSCYKGERY